MTLLSPARDEAQARQRLTRGPASQKITKVSGMTEASDCGSGTSIRFMRPSEVEEASALVRRVFDQHVAPLYTPEGTAEIRGYVGADRLAHRSAQGHWVLVATQGGRIVGVAEVRGNERLSLLFVDNACQRRGIGRRLVDEAVRVCRQQNPKFAEITVHSSPNSVGAYEAMGFRSIAPMQTEHGVVFCPMARPVVNE